MNTRRLMVLALLAAWTATAAAQTDWIPYEGNPVIPRPEADSWAGLLRWVEDVVVVDGIYHMFFTGTRTAFWVDHTIGHATSPDGISWTMDSENPVMVPVPEGDWDATSFASLAVIHDGTEFLMWYGTVDPNGYCQTGMATSPDGTTWSRYPGNPVFETGPVGSFDEGLVFPGTVLVQGGLFHMWYSALETPTPPTADRGSIGYATSSDGVTWTKHPSPILETGSESAWDRSLIYGPEVVFDGASYHMWYTGAVIFGPSWLSVQIGYATSPDGITWTKDTENPIDELGIWKAQPRVLLHANARECEMFYNGEYPGDFSVNRATSTCQMYSKPRPRRPSRRVAPVR